MSGVIALSEDERKVVERYTYTAFGGVTIRDTNDEPRETSDVNNPYMFTGRRYDPETGNYYYRARHYSPELGRFMQTDPLGLEAGLNLYTYVKNNPIMWLDPWGLKRYGAWETNEIIWQGRIWWHWWYHAPLGRYDFKHWNDGDTFFVYGRGIMSASEFGNYMAGYMSSYHWGRLGYAGVRAAGHGDALFENSYLAAQGLDPEHLLDEPESIRDLRRGREDALADRQQEYDDYASQKDSDLQNHYGDIGDPTGVPDKQVPEWGV